MSSAVQHHRLKYDLEEHIYKKFGDLDWGTASLFY
jgi:hypothetical protein